ncbi:MAG: helix-turn-helix domain-containing protein [bacterium]|nr:helix-turn-helix domain-containing protein [bacterium]
MISGFLRTEEAAEFLGVAPVTLKRWRYDGQVNRDGKKPPKYYKVGRKVVYRVEDLRAWVQNCEVATE